MLACYVSEKIRYFQQIVMKSQNFWMSTDYIYVFIISIVDINLLSNALGLSIFLIISLS